MKIQRLFAAAAFALCAAAAFALPSVDQVQEQIRQGHYAQAETMMQEVVAAKPDSARAHYILAEILAHNARFDQAAQEAAKAAQLDPQTHFTDPARFAAFRQELQRQQNSAARSLSLGSPAVAAPAYREPARSSGMPGWGWVLLIAGGAALLFAITNRRRGAGYANGPMGPGLSPGQPGYMPGMAPGYGPGYGQPGAGSGLLGTGLAVAGGVAAGMFAERLMEGNRGAGSGLMSPGPVEYTPDNSAATELENRPVDFGNGDGWGGGDGGGGGFDGGGFDSGGGSSDGGW